MITENKGKFQCIYCGKMHNMNGWKSEFAAHAHYKAIMCSCGKKTRIRVVDGSGHDDWSVLEKKLIKEEKKEGKR